MSTTKPAVAIRLSITPEVGRALKQAKKRYPTLSGPEILKLGLSKIVSEDQSMAAYETERDEIRRTAAYSVGHDYLSDPAEDIYTLDMGQKVDFS